MNPAIEVAFATPRLLGQNSDQVTADAQAIAPGGKATNVARILQQLGYQQTTLLYLDAISSTPRSKLFQDLLVNSGCMAVPIPALRDIRVSVVIASHSLQVTHVVRTKGINDTNASTLTERVLRSLSELANGDWLICAGSLPGGLPDDLYFVLSQFAIQKGARVALDCDGAALRHGISAHPHVVKVNREEAISCLEESSPERLADDFSELSVEQLANLLKGLGASLSIVTDGPRKLAWSSENESGSLQPSIRAALTATGAGDAFLAGLIKSMATAKSQKLRDHLDYAAEVGAAAVGALSSGELPNNGRAQLPPS